MKTTLDAAGRIVVPKVRLVGSQPELEPTAASVRLERRGGLTVAVPVEPKATVTGAEVNAVLQSIRTGRAR
ncbi:MAG: hypothetical protein NDJ94_04830 [Vicinamibacteria bacterium]|nr:hypothetical protein [Vicinamibacteria bacterium]